MGGKSYLWLFSRLSKSLAWSKYLEDFFMTDVMFSYLSKLICLYISFCNFQVVRLKLSNNKRIVGTLIPTSCINTLLKVLSMGSEESEETIY